MTTADVVINQGDDYPVNVIFVAAGDDPIWEDLTGISIPGGPEFSPGEFNVARSPVAEGVDLGNVSFDVPAGTTELSFDSVELLFASVPHTQEVGVGQWRIREIPRPSDMSETGDYILTMDSCQEISASFVNGSSRNITSATATIEPSGVEVTGLRIETPVPSGGEFDVSIALTCDASADFYLLSPRLVLGTDQEDIEIWLEPVSVGLTSINEDVVERIRRR